MYYLFFTKVDFSEMLDAPKSFFSIEGRSADVSALIVTLVLAIAVARNELFRDRDLSVSSHKERGQTQVEVSTRIKQDYLLRFCVALVAFTWAVAAFNITPEPITSLLLFLSGGFIVLHTTDIFAESDMLDSISVRLARKNQKDLMDRIAKLPKEDEVPCGNIITLISCYIFGFGAVVAVSHSRGMVFAILIFLLIAHFFAIFVGTQSFISFGTISRWRHAFTGVSTFILSLVIFGAFGSIVNVLASALSLVENIILCIFATWASIYFAWRALGYCGDGPYSCLARDMVSRVNNDTKFSVRQPMASFATFLVRGLIKAAQSKTWEFDDSIWSDELTRVTALEIATRLGDPVETLPGVEGGDVIHYLTWIDNTDPNHAYEVKGFVYPDWPSDVMIYRISKLEGSKEFKDV